MIAAYALALQMLVSGAAASQMAATASSGSFPICFGATVAADGTGQGDQTPIHQAPCIVCAAALAAPVDIPHFDATPAYSGTGVVLAPNTAQVFLPAPPPSPRLSQGPPQTV